MRKAILKGYYGYGNFGDDLFLYFFVKHILPLLNEYFFIIPISGSNVIPKDVSITQKNVMLENYYLIRRIINKGKLIKRHLEAKLLIWGVELFYMKVRVLKG